MNDSEINIAIAEWCGWTQIHADTETFPGMSILCGMVWNKKGHEQTGLCQAIPDFVSDLNAMHEAEKKLDTEVVDVQSLYWDYLALVTMPEPFPRDDTFLRDFKMIRSTARQRAEALLRTLGKWREQ